MSPLPSPELLALALLRAAAPERRPVDAVPANDNLATSSSRVGAAQIQTIFATWRGALADLAADGPSSKAVP